MKRSKFKPCELQKIFKPTQDLYDWYITAQQIEEDQKEFERQQKLNTEAYYNSLPDLRDNLVGEPVKIEIWDDLRNIQSIGNYYLDIEEYSGCIREKDTNEYKMYLSTHTFYGRNYQGSTEILQRFGFNVELVSWDKVDKNTNE